MFRCPKKPECESIRVFCFSFASYVLYMRDFYISPEPLGYCSRRVCLSFIMTSRPS